MWSGNDERGQQIYLHSECVFDWYPRLMRDALELRYSGKTSWNQLSSPTHG